MNDTLQNIRNAVLSAPAVHCIKIVGIDGPSGSGKTTLAAKLAPLLNAPVIPIDDFVSWNSFAGWWPRFEQQVLDPLLGGQPARYQQRDWEGDEFGDSLGGWTTVSWSPVVLIEGVTCTRRESLGKFSFSIWVEAPKDERLRRGIDRDAFGIVGWRRRTRSSRRTGRASGLTSWFPEPGPGEFVARPEITERISSARVDLASRGSTCG